MMDIKLVQHLCAKKRLSKSKQLTYDYKVKGNSKGIVDTCEEIIPDNLDKNNTPDKFEIENQPNFPKAII